MRKTSRIVLMTLLSLVLVFGCRGPVSPEDSSDPGETDDGTDGDASDHDGIPSLFLAEFAADLYDSVDAGGSDEVLRDSMTALDLYKSPVANLDEFVSLIDSGEVFIIEEQIAAMSDGFDEGILVPVESFVEVMADWGAYVRATGSPLTLPDFNSIFEGLHGKEFLREEEVIPAMVLALGHERKERMPGYDHDDPIWADGYLDPLQFLLLSYSVLLSGNEFSPSMHGGTPGGVSQPPAYSTSILDDFDSWSEYFDREMRKKIRDFVRDAISELVGIPLTRADALKAIIAGSVVLYGYSFDMDVPSSSVNRRCPENPPSSEPHETIVEATLQFEFIERNELSRVIVEYCLGESTPDNGRVTRNPVEWSLDGEVENHGTLHVHDTETNNMGECRATFSADDEIVPRVLRNPELSDVAGGTVQVIARELLPNKWRGLEAIAREFRGVGVAATYLTVNYHLFPDIRVRFDTTVHWNFDDLQIQSRFYAEVPLDAPSPCPFDFRGHYSGTSVLNYQSLEVTSDDPVTAIGEDGVILVEVGGSDDFLVWVADEETPIEHFSAQGQNSHAALGWVGFGVANSGNEIQGPWQTFPYGQVILARSEYSASGAMDGLPVVAEVKVEILRD